MIACLHRNHDVKPSGSKSINFYDRVKHLPTLEKRTLMCLKVKERFEMKGKVKFSRKKENT